MNYSELNDYQINNLVHNVIVCGGKYTLVFGEDYDIRWIDNSDGLAFKTSKQSYGTELKNYCNSWADAGSIIQENYLSVECDDMFDVPMPSSYWKAHNPKGNHYTDTNPLRAAMIVFLMMQEKK